MTEKCCPSRDPRDLLLIAPLFLLFLVFPLAKAADDPAALGPTLGDRVRLQISRLAWQGLSLMIGAFPGLAGVGAG